MKKLLCLGFAALVIGCGSSNKVKTTYTPPTNNNPPITAPITALDAEAIRVLGLEIHDILGRPSGADLPDAVRFTDVIASTFTLNASGQGPQGGTVTVQPGKTIVFEGYKTSAGSVINGTIVVTGATETYQDLEFVDSVGERDVINGTLQVAFTVLGPITNLTIISNFRNEFDNDSSSLELIDHVSHRTVDASNPQSVFTTVNDTGRIRAKHGKVDYQATLTMPKPFVTTTAGLQSGQMLLTGIAPSQQNLRLDVVPGGEHLQVYLQQSPGQPFELITTI